MFAEALCYVAADYEPRGRETSDAAVQRVKADRLEPVEHAALVRIVWRQQRGEHDRGEYQQQDQAADEGGAVAQQPAADALPVAAAAPGGLSG